MSDPRHHLEHGRSEDDLVPVRPPERRANSSLLVKSPLGSARRSDQAVTAVDEDADANPGPVRPSLLVGRAERTPREALSRGSFTGAQALKALRTAIESVGTNRRDLAAWRDMVGMLAVRAIDHDADELAQLWSTAQNYSHETAVAIGLAFPQLLDHRLRNNLPVRALVQQFGRTLKRAEDEERLALSRALLAADTVVPDAHPVVVEIIRAHRAVLEAEPITWSHFSPYA